MTLDMVELQAKNEVLSEKPDPVPVLSTIIQSQTAMGLRPSICCEKPVAKSLRMTRCRVNWYSSRVVM